MLIYTIILYINYTYIYLNILLYYLYIHKLTIVSYYKDLTFWNGQICPTPFVSLFQ